MNATKVSVIILIVFLVGIYSILLAQKINLTTADLGRHIKNGELFFQNFSVPQGNIYSYTYPKSPFINHHWGSGVIFYSVYSFAGFKGISILFILLSLATFLIFFDIAVKYSSLAIAGVTSVFIIPVLGSRVEIRPEVFSYLFLALFFWILWNYSQEKISRRWLFILPPLAIIWINLHIYFFLGIALIGAFLAGSGIEYLITKNKKLIRQSKWFFIILVSSALSFLINPAGYSGVLYPLKIFKNYGYRLFENQSVWFISKLMDYPPALYFEIAFGIFLAGWIIAIYMAIKKRGHFPITNFIISLAFGAIGWLAIRNFPLFGYFALPITAINIGKLFEKGADKSKKPEYFSTTAAMAIVLVVLIIINPDYWHSKSNIGLGLEPKVSASAEFFKKENLSGPIFNNYDIGGYLIYYLYPKESIFVDNRPEAYPEKFFSETYVPMQEKENKWQEKSKEYNFNAIFFYRNDLTPWAQSFLIKRISDPDWAPIYVDDYSIIFLKRNNLNQSKIQKYELPKSLFNIK